MAAQQARQDELMRTLKKKLARKDDASEDDEPPSRPTNRGNKLKRGAKYVREGRLDLGDGPRSYKQTVEHAGYQRDIIYKNPPQYDEDGEEIDEDEDEDEETPPNEENIYADIDLTKLLAPLGSAADLPTHPSMAHPYTSNALPEMVENARQTLQKEQQSLKTLKLLLTNFRGDSNWVPAGMMQTEHDDWLLNRRIPNTATAGFATNGTGDMARTDTTWEGASGSRARPDTEGLKIPPASRGRSPKAPETEKDVEMEDEAALTQPNGDSSHDTREDHTQVPTEIIPDLSPAQNGHSAPEGQPRTAAAAEDQSKEIPATANGIHLANDQLMSEAPPSDAQPLPEASNHPEEGLPSPESEQDSGPSHRMTTRARANRTPTRSPRTGSPFPQPSPPQTVHPFFTFPTSSIPDSNFGLDPQLADKTRYTLIQHVSKQEQVVRGCQELYNGLLQALRMRDNVFKWCKAEAHVGEMSDGEDWYDKEEWGLTEDLVKGREEEDDETTAVGGKKRRTRAER